ncbi:tRNA 4-thiouridine(8) synthase ThiI [candidate division KSB1 bacterium]|nr:tRNA 4-thiouridine(8) synthase ThiI [candidate division KSB1 bacterium]
MTIPTEKYIIIHYSEIGLKKGNRDFFENALKRNIQRMLSDLVVGPIFIDYGRFLLTIKEDSPLQIIAERLRQTFGIAHFSIAYQGDLDVEVLKKQIVEKIEKTPFNSFAIETRRIDKEYPIKSRKVNEIVGEYVLETLNKKVNLSAPDLRCNIQIYNKKVIFYYERVEGLRGLPVGSSGKVVCLLSSGIDSPVAAYQMMSRGCKVIFVHFHSFPFTDKRSYYNAISLVQTLTKFQNRSLLYLVPLAKIQEIIIAVAPAKYRLLLYRRMMFRFAEGIANKEKAKALVTGESLGQVASQTLENLTATSQVVEMPILRPLIGIDKETIIKHAQTIGTFQTSIEPYSDCCSFLVPPNVATRAKIEELVEIEQKLGDFNDLLFKTFEESESKILEFPEKIQVAGD